MKENKRSYFNNLLTSFRSLKQGLMITLGHLRRSTKKRTIVPITDPQYFAHTEGISTIQYPHEMIPVPDNGRYRLHNEIDDCIVCDKCAKICPVDCIEIEPVRAVEEFGRTSDGTPKRIYAARFDIDMAKCCFCGLCTTVCPTECLTMTKVFDFSVAEIHDHIYAFAEMSEEEIKEKRNVFEAHQNSKPPPAPPASPSAENKPTTEAPKPGVAKPVFRPKIKPPGSTPPTT
ncbi:MAG: 4Fe-4S dicluster domain-containing protein [Cyclobacteriaceae bacterium]